LNKALHKYIVYVSLIFVTVALYKANYLHIPQIISFPFLCSSIFLLCLGFIGSAISWFSILKLSQVPAPFFSCLASIGLSIFGKYIPGKIWIIMGRATYISENYGYPIVKLARLSLYTQLIALWSGLTLGVIGIFYLNANHILSWFALFLWTFLSLTLFSNMTQRAIKATLKVLFKKKIVLYSPNYQLIFKVLPWFFGYWILWAFGFYLLAISLINANIQLSLGLGFSLAGTFGIMTVIAPGGLGVREGFLVGYLLIAGLNGADATTLSVSSRLWFLLGEIFIFFIGLCCHQALKKKKLHSTKSSFLF